MRPLPLLWYLSNLLLDHFRNQRVKTIIQPGMLELLAEVIGGGFPAMFQSILVQVLE